MAGTLTLSGDPQRKLTVGRFDAIVVGPTLRIPVKLFELVVQVRSRQPTAETLCDMLTAVPAHFVAGLHGDGWKYTDLQNAESELHTLLAEQGHPYTPLPDPEPRSFGAHPPQERPAR